MTELTYQRLYDMYTAAMKAMPGPWLYRPYKFDDWGVIRAGADKEGSLWTLANVRAARDVTQHEMHVCRVEGTDPYADNACHIANCDPQTIMAMINEIRSLRGKLCIITSASICR